MENQVEDAMEGGSFRVSLGLEFRVYLPLDSKGRRNGWLVVPVSSTI